MQQSTSSADRSPTSPLHSQCNGDRFETHAARVRQLQSQRRRRWILLFALVVLVIGSLRSASGQEGHFVYRPSTEPPAPEPGAVIDPWRINGGVMRHPDNASSRPRYVELAAQLANFDADADPDGWRAQVIIRDQNDRPVEMPSRAKFELMPRLAMTDRRQWIDGQPAPIRWSVPLEFDADGVATVDLPLKHKLRPLLGWSTATLPQSGLRSSNHGISRRELRHYSRLHSFVTTDLRASIGTPNLGQLRVRVSIPTQGVFDSVVPVQIRPPVLVDTAWPYR